MDKLPDELIFAILIFDLSNIKKIKLLNKGINLIVESNIDNLFFNRFCSILDSKNYEEIFLKKKRFFFENRFFFNNKFMFGNILNIFFKKNHSKIENVYFYTFIFDLVTNKQTQEIICSYIYLFFEEKCHLSSKKFLEENDFSKYEKDLTQIKNVLRYVDMYMKDKLNDILTRKYYELRLQNI
jgi:hypothetical protein